MMICRDRHNATASALRRNDRLSASIALIVEDVGTAIFTSQNLITIDAARAIHSLGLSRTVALVGFDDVVFGDVVQPGLTVLAQDPVGLGRRAAELLFARLDGFDGPTQEVVLEPTLVERGSGELPAPVGAS